MYQVKVETTMPLSKYAETKLPNSSYTPLLVQVAGRVTTDEQGLAVKRCIDHIAKACKVPLRLPTHQQQSEKSLWGAMGCVIDHIGTPLCVEDIVRNLLSDLRHPEIQPNDKDGILDAQADYVADCLLP